jgi:hypothetical protein
MARTLTGLRWDVTKTALNGRLNARDSDGLALEITARIYIRQVSILIDQETNH